MKRLLSLFAAVLVVGAMAGAAPVGLAQDETAGEPHEEPRPGERLSGVIGVHDAELNGELEERTFGIRVAKAATDEARADVVIERLNATEDRLEELEDRITELRDDRDRGEITQGQYQAQMARIAAERATIERTASQVDTVAGDLPAALLEDKGINATLIQELRTNASQLGGPEVAEIAQRIAGPDTGQTMADQARDHAPVEADPPETTGDHNQTPTDTGNDAPVDTEPVDDAATNETEGTEETEDDNDVPADETGSDTADEQQGENDGNAGQ